MVKWKPSQTQQSGVISRTFDFFNDELTELQKQPDCPDEFIFESFYIIKNLLPPDSFHSKERHHKSDNPSFH